MDSSVVHSKIARQSVTDACDKSDYQMLEGQSRDKSPLLNLLKEKRKGRAERGKPLKQERTQPITFTETSFSQKSTKHHKTSELYKDSPVSAKRVLLRWWLDTLGHSNPLITAWENEEHYIHRLTTQPHTKSLTFVGGPISYRHSPESGACRYVSKQDARLQNSASHFTGFVNFLVKKTEVQKTESLFSYAKSPRSDESVNPQDGFIINTTAKVGNLKKCSASGVTEILATEKKPDDAVCQQPAKLIIKNEGDENASSNVYAHIPADRPIKQNQINVTSIAEKGNAQILLDNMFTPSLSNVNIQGIGNPHTKQIEKHACSQLDNNSDSPVLPPRGMMDVEKYPSSASFKSPIESSIPGTNEFRSKSALNDKDLKCGSNVDPDIKQRNGNNKYSHLGSFVGPESEGNSLTSQSKDQSYSAPGDNCCNNSSRMSLAEEICTNSKTLLNIDRVAKGSNLDSVQLSLTTNLPFRKNMPTGHEKGNSRSFSPVPKVKLFNSASMVKKYPTYDESDNLTLNMSYFSRLAEKRFNTKKRLNDCHEIKPHILQNCDHDLELAQNGIVHAQGSSTQIRQTKRSTQLLSEAERSTSCVHGKDMAVCGNTKPYASVNAQTDITSETQSIASQCTFQISRSLPLSLECRARYQPINFVQRAKSHTNEHQYSGDWIAPQNMKVHYAKDRDDPFSGRSFDEKNAIDTGGFNPSKCSLNGSEYSYAYSCMPSVSRTCSDFNEKSSLKWVAGTWSNTSLPQVAERRSCRNHQNLQPRRAVSQTNMNEQRQKEILEKAKLLVLMFDELKLGDRTWSTALFTEEDQQVFGGNTNYKPKFIDSKTQRNTKKPFTTNTPSKISAYSKPQRNVSFTTATPHALTHTRDDAGAPDNINAAHSGVLLKRKQTNMPQNMLADLTKHLQVQEFQQKSDSSLCSLKDSTKVSCSFSSIKPSVKIRNDGNQSLLLRRRSEVATCDHQDIVKQQICTATPIWSKCPNLKSRGEKATTFRTVPGDHKSAFDEVTINSLIHYHKPYVESCMKTINKLKRRKALHPPNFLRDNSMYKMQKSFSDRMTLFSKNRPYLLLNSGKEQTKHPVPLYKKSNLSVKINLNKPEKCKQHLKAAQNNSQKNFQKIHKKFIVKNTDSNILNRLQSERLLKTVSAATADNTEKKPHNFETDSVPQCENESSAIPCEPATASEAASLGSCQEDKTVSPSSLEKLSKRVPVYPRPVPHALGAAPDGDMTKGNKASSASTVSSETSFSSFFSKNLCLYGHSMMKNDGQRISHTPEVHSVNTCVLSKSKRAKCMEIMINQGNNESNFSKARVKVLPPLCHARVDKITSEKDLQNMTAQNFRMLHSAASHDQHENREEKTCSSEAKQSVGPATQGNLMIRNRCTSPEKSRCLNRRIILDSLQMSRTFYPLRRKIGRMKYKVSDVLIIPNSKCKVSLASHSSVNKNVTLGNANEPNMKQNISRNLEVTVPQGDTCHYNLSLFVGKNSARNALGNISNVQSSNGLKTAFNSSADTESIKACSQNNSLTETSCSKVDYKKSKICDKNSAYPDTKSFNFLMLLMSDEIGSNEGETLRKISPV